MPERRVKRQFVRFTRTQRTLHACMIVSLMTLSLTGLSLRFSYTRWAVFVSHLFGGVEMAGTIHRAAAVLMLGVFFVHIVDLLITKHRSGLSWFRFVYQPHTILFTRRDLTEFIGTVKWHWGIGKRPQYGRWTYWEKFDYIALWAGTGLVGATGLIMWFPEFFARYLPGWCVNVAAIVHNNEALLAIGSLFVIHFYNAHLRPEKFPMDTAIFTGRVPLSEMKRDKPREYEDLVAAGKLEEHLAEPIPHAVVRIYRLFAWLALATGISILVWIVYAFAFAPGR